MTTLTEKATPYANAFTYNKEKQIIVSTDSGSELASAITFYVDQNTSLDMDSVYEFTYGALTTIAENLPETEDEAHELMDSFEADPYTSNLTAWLAKSPNNVEYLTRAIEEYEAKDGITALSQAQQLAMEEVGHLVVDFLSDL